MDYSARLSNVCVYQISPARQVWRAVASRLHRLSLELRVGIGTHLPAQGKSLDKYRPRLPHKANHEIDLATDLARTKSVLCLTELSKRKSSRVASAG